jgi:hypothetical protein
MKKILIAFLVIIAAPSFVTGQSERKTPTGQEIAAVVKRYKMKEKSTFELNGKKIHFTAAVIADSMDASLKNGFFMGVLENEIAGDETGLPPGRYNLYYTPVCGGCKDGTQQSHVYAEANGKIVAEALRVSWLNERKGTKSVEFIPKGWGFYYYMPYSSYSSIISSTTTTGSGSIIGCSYCTLVYYF